MEYFDSFMLFLLFDERNICKVQNTFFRSGVTVSESLSTSVKRPPLLKNVIHYLFVPLTVISFTTVSVWYCLSRRSRKKKDQNVEKIRFQIRNGTVKRFPVFLLFGDDVELVLDHFIPALYERLNVVFERDEPFKLICLEDVYFKPGRSKLQETERLFDVSSVVVAIVSAEFLEDPYAKSQLEIACVMGKPVLLLLIENIENTMLPKSWLNFQIVHIVCKSIQNLNEFELDVINDLLIELISETIPLE